MGALALGLLFLVGSSIYMWSQLAGQQRSVGLAVLLGICSLSCLGPTVTERLILDRAPGVHARAQHPLHL